MEVPKVKYWRMVLVLSGVTFLSGASNLSIILALPDIAQEFGASLFVIIWVVLGYSLISNALAIPMGRLADMYGRKKLLLVGLSIFGIGNLLAFFSQDITQLVGTRIIMGVGAAMTAGLAQAIAVDVAPASSRGKALGIATSGWSIGVLSGPVIGGLLLTLTSWRIIFLLFAVFAVFIAISAIILLPKIKTARLGGHFDFIGAILFPLSLASMLMAMTLGMDPRLGTSFQIPLFVISLVLFALFVVAEWKGKHPMIDFRLLKDKQYSFALGLGGLYTLSHQGFPVAITFYLVALRGFSSLEVAMVLIIAPIIGLLGPVGGWISDKVSVVIPIGIGFFLVAIGFLGLALGTATLSILGLLLMAGVIGVGALLAWTPTTSMALGAVGKENLAVGASILFSARQVGSQMSQALFVLVIGSFVGGAADQIFRRGSDPSVSDISAGLLGMQTVFQLNMLVAVAGFLRRPVRLGGDDVIEREIAGVSAIREEAQERL
ncbi:MAG: MFS transporter [Nitrosopumilus sp.]